MIKFFRHIRQKLLSENKFSKYLLYAIGEIALVMIGILLALQVNNWNEESKEREVELGILRQIKKTLTEDLVYENENYAIKNAINSSDIIIEHLVNKLPYSDSLDIHFGNLSSYRLHMPNTSAYDNLKSIGFGIIRNDSLREKYQKLYVINYRFSAFTRNNIDLKKAEKFNEFFFDNFIDIEWEKNATPIDYYALCENQKFIEFVKWNKKQNLERKEVSNWTIQEIKNVIQLIDDELKIR